MFLNNTLYCSMQFSNQTWKAKIFLTIDVIFKMLSTCTQIMKACLLRIWLNWDERVYNGNPHNNVAALKVSVVHAIANVPCTHSIIACSQFWQLEETVIMTGSGFNEGCHPVSMWSPLQSVKKYFISSVHSSLNQVLIYF